MTAAGAKAGSTRAASTRRVPPPLEHRILMTATLCLLALGAVMVYSASSPRDLLAGQGNGTGEFVRYVIFAGLGLLAMHVLERRGLVLLDRRLVSLLLLASFGLVVLVMVPGFGVQVNGARRWFVAGPVQFQPSELLKLSLVLYVARFLAEHPKRLRSFRQAVMPIALVAGPACLLIVVEPYQRARLTSFLHPWSSKSTAGFQAVQGQIAVGSGGLLGVGLGRSVQKVFYLPEAQTDFILAVIGEELGVVGIFGVVFLYGMIAYAGLRTARRAAGRYAKLLATGLTSLILCQGTLNIFVVLGLAPLTGVPLPFISYAPTNLCIVLAAIGLLLNIGRPGARRLQVVEGPRRERAEDRDRRRRDRGARRAGAGGGRRAAR